MAVVADDVLRATASFMMSRDTVMQNVYHFLYSGAGDSDDECGDEILAQMGNIYDNLESFLDDQFASEELDVWKWDFVLDQFDGIYTEPFVGIQGSNVGVSLPNGAAALVRLFTGLPRRQGRKYIGGFSESVYLETGWTAGAIGGMALAIADMVSPIATLNGTLTPGVFNQETETFEPFKNAGALNTFCAYQRRRRPGVGI